MGDSGAKTGLQRVLGRGEVWAFISVLCYTAVSLLVRRATGGGDRFVAVTLRALPAFLLTLGVVLASPHRRAQLTPRVSRNAGKALRVAGRG